MAALTTPRKSRISTASIYLGLLQALVGILLLLLCLWFWFTSKNSLLSVVASTKTVATTLASQVDHAKVALQTNQRVLTNTRGAVRSYRESAYILNMSLPQLAANNQTVLAEAQRTITTFSNSVAIFHRAASNAISGANGTLVEVSNLADVGGHFAITLKETASRMLPQTSQTLAAVDNALSAYEESTSETRTLASKIVPQSQTLLENASKTIAAGKSSLSQTKESLIIIDQQLPQIEKSSAEWQRTMKELGQAIKQLSQDLRFLRHLPMAGNSIDSGLLAINDGGQNFVSQGERLKDVSDIVIQQANALFVSATNLVIVGSNSLEAGQATATVISQMVAQYETQFTNSCAETAAALGSARKSIAALSDSQNDLGKEIQAICDQTVKSLDLVKQSCATMKTDTGQTQRTLADLAEATQRILIATRISLETADRAETKIVSSLTNSLVQTCNALSQAESGLASLSQTDIPEMTLQLGEVSKTIRNFEGMVGQTIPVISFLGVIGIILSSFMIISGLQLFRAGRQLNALST